MANLIGSLRLISSFDWSEFFESVSLVEQVLQRDPAGVYARMDFRSRDRYRHAVEELADPTGEGQLRVALKSVERARRIAERTPERARRARRLPPDRPRTARSSSGASPGSRRWGSACAGCSSAAPTPVTSGTIALGTALLVAAALSYALRTRLAAAAALLVVALLGAVPASELTIQILQRIAQPPHSAAPAAAARARPRPARRADDGHRADDPRQRGAGPRARRRISRSRRSATSIRTSTSRC